MAEYASKGVAGAGLGLGIAGTALGVLNSGGMLGSLFNNGCNPGWNNHNCGCGCSVNAGLFAAESNRCVDDTRRISALEADLARERSERYADSVATAVYREAVSMSNAKDEKINANYKELAQAVAALDKDAAVNKEHIACLQDGVAREFRAVREEFASAIALESERRSCGDQNLYSYVNATFVPGKLVMPKEAICPPVMERYNSWVAPTDTANTASA